MKNLIAKIYIFIRPYLLTQIFIHVVKWIMYKDYRYKHNFIYPNHVYHSFISYFISHHFKFLLFPITSYLIKKKIRISINNLYAMGHIYPEIDYLNRVASVTDFGLINKVYYIVPKNPLTLGLSEILSTKKVKIIESGILNVFIYPIALCSSSVYLDCAHSTIRHQKGNLITAKNLPTDQAFLARQVPYAKIRSESMDFYPLVLKNSLSDEMKNMVGGGPYAVIQIKDVSVNATALPTDPSTYVLAIKHLQMLGYNVIFAGTEQIPEIFIELNVINYAGSKLQCSLNDYLLVLNSFLVLSSSSGFAYLADVLDKPLLAVNNWTISGYPGRKTMQIPTLMFENGQKVNFKRQSEIHLNGYQNLTSSNFSPDLTFEDASADLILEALKELINFCSIIPIKPNELQLAFNSQFPNGVQGNGRSVVPTSFILKNMDRMDFIPNHKVQQKVE